MEKGKTASATSRKGTGRTMKASAKSHRLKSANEIVRRGEATDEALRETFEQLCLGRSSHLPLNLIGVALRMNNQCPSEAELSKIIEDHKDVLDADVVPEIDFDDFCAIMRANWRSRDQLLEEISGAFSTFDPGDTGIISADEFRTSLTSLGEVIDEAEVTELLKDANMIEGKIPYSDLIRLMLDAYSRPTSKKGANKKARSGSSSRK